MTFLGLRMLIGILRNILIVPFIKTTIVRDELDINDQIIG